MDDFSQKPLSKCGIFSEENRRWVYWHNYLFSLPDICKNIFRTNHPDLLQKAENLNVLEIAGFEKFKGNFREHWYTRKKLRLRALQQQLMAKSC